jgi:NADPH:quinone reductase-like Zn-dependent oxidoreductase
MGLEGLRVAEQPDSKGPAAGDVLVEVHSVALNYRDLLVAKGLYGGIPDRPFIPTSDMAGVVVTVGSGVTSFKPGDRVVNAPFRCWPAGMMRPEWLRTFIGGGGVDGVLTEQILYPADSLVKLPDHLSFDEGSTLTIAGLTAWAAVVTHGSTKPGEWVLLHGTGGVSIFAAQLAAQIGARTILTTSSPEKGKIVKERFGVTETVDYRESEWPKWVREITGGQGVDVVVESAGGPTIGQSIQACNYGGRVGVIGLLAGLEAEFNVVDLMVRQVTVRGIFMESAEELRLFARAMEVGRIHPHIDRRFSFNEAPAAYRYLESQKHIGKVVIRVRE